MNNHIYRAPYSKATLTSLQPVPGSYIDQNQSPTRPWHSCDFMHARSAQRLFKCGQTKT